MKDNVRDGVKVGVLVGVFVEVEVKVDVAEAVTVEVGVGVFVSVGVDVEVVVNVKDGMKVAVGVLVGVNEDVGTTTTGFGVLVGVLTIGLYGGSYEYVEVGQGFAVFVAGATRVAVAVKTFVNVSGRTVGVVVGNRASGVLVGTGERSSARKVPTRSCGVPLDGISVMICIRIFSLMGGTLKELGSRL